LANRDRQDNDDEEADTLGTRYTEIVRYTRKEGFTLFPARNKSDYHACYMSSYRWDNKRRPWKEFFNIAKKQGVALIVVRVKVFTNGDLRTIRALEQSLAWPNSADSDGRENYFASNINHKDLLAKHVGKLGGFSFLWMAGACAFSLTEVADWYKPVEDYFANGYDIVGNNIAVLSAQATYSRMCNGSDSHCCSCCYRNPETIGLPKAVKERRLEDFAQASTTEEAKL
jgi:hypothetical protein